MIRTIVRFSESKAIMEPITKFLKLNDNRGGGLKSNNVGIKQSRSDFESQLLRNGVDKKDNIGGDLNVMSLLKKPNSDFEIELRVKSLESATNKQHNQVQFISKRLEYILDNLGYKFPINDNNILINKLMNMNNSQINNLIKQIANQDELMIILSHLIFRNQLTTSLFANIIMKLDLIEILGIDEQLTSNPSMILGFEKIQTQIKTMIILSSRYRMLNSHELANSIIEQYLTTLWLPSIRSKSFTDLNYFRNIINLVNHHINEQLMEEYVIETKSNSFAYIFWEQHPLRSTIREYLESEILTSSDLSKYQILIIKLFNNPLISSSKKNSLELRSISTRLNLSTSSKVNHARFIGLIEVFLNNLRDSNKFNDVDEFCFESLIREFEDFKFNDRNVDDNGDQKRNHESHTHIFT